MDNQLEFDDIPEKTPEKEIETTLEESKITEIPLIKF